LALPWRCRPANLGELITQTFGLDDIGAALDYCAGERGGRAVVVFSGDAGS
jgi:hypothetical protein